MTILLTFIGVIIGGVSVVSVGLMVWQTLSFLGKKELPLSISPSQFPIISILKPIKGLDEELAQNLEFFLNLEGVSYEVLIGIADDADPAVSLVADFLAKHPEAPMRLIITGAPGNLQPKMANLAGLEALARGDILLVSDGNTRPHPKSLLSVVAVFEDARVGVASASFFVRNAESLGARFRALRIGTLILTSVCGVYSLSKTPVIVGKWMAVRKRAIADSGGFATLGEVMCADGLIAAKLRALGWDGAIIPNLIDVYLGEWDLGQAYAQQLRWSRHIRFVEPLEPVAELFWNGSFLLLMAAVFWWLGGFLGAIFLGVAAFLVWGFYGVVYLRFGGSWRDLLLLPLQDLMMLFIAFWCYFGNEVVWRGQRFRIGKGGVLEEVIK
jgi:ceramide glucosyltransferase